MLAMFGMASPAYVSAAKGVQTSQSTQQAKKITGTVVDENGEAVIGASVVVKGTSKGTITDINGSFSLDVAPGTTLNVTYIGFAKQSIKVGSANDYRIVMKADDQLLDEVVVTAMGIKKERKSLGYAVEDIDSEELMRNKSVNPINSLAGKIAGVSVTQGGGAAGAGSQIILRGGTSLERDNQPLFVVDGIIYDNSTNILGNSAFDGSTSTSSTNSNRVMDINPEDIENMSVLKGPAAAALYGSRAAAGVVIITTKKGKEGAVEVNFSTKYTTQWATNLPKVQQKYGRGFYEDQYDDNGNYLGTTYNDFSYDSWGAPIESGTPVYDNIGDFFEQGGSWDTNVSVSGGTENSNFFLSGSYYNQDGIIPTTGYEKATFRFNGEQKWKIFTFGANVAYSQANTDKTLTSAGLYGSSGSGTMTSVYRWSPTDDMKHYLNEDGTRYRMFGDRLDVTEERDNPYWIINKNKLQDQTERFTGSFNVRADITDWWWISYRMGIDSYTMDDSKVIGAGGVYKLDWQNGMYSENSYRYKYLSTNLMTNFNKQFGDFTVYVNGNVSDFKTVVTDWNNPTGLLSSYFSGKVYGDIYGFESDRLFTEDDFTWGQDANGNKVRTGYAPGVANQDGLVGSGNFEYSPGDMKYKDLNGDGVIDGGNGTKDNMGDLKVIGNSIPRFQYGFRLGGSWKGIDLDMYFQGVGKWNQWTTSSFTMPMSRGADGIYANQMDYWTEDNTDAEWPRLYPGVSAGGTVSGIASGAYSYYPQTRWLIDRSYLRFKTLTVGYTLPQDLTKKWYIEKLRVYFTAENLCELINNSYAPVDPEIDTGENNSTSNGAWGRVTPMMRTISCGLQVTF